MELTPNYKPPARHLIAALLALTAAAVAGIALLWPALQARDQRALALQAAAQRQTPGALLILYADQPPDPRDAPPEPLAWIALDPDAPPPELALWGRVLLLREGADPPTHGLEVLDRRLYGDARLWLARNPHALRSLGDAAPPEISLARGGERWPCAPGPGGWRCPRAGGHLAISPAPSCLRAHPWERGALRLEGAAPPGATHLRLGWELDGDRPATLRTEPGAQPLTLTPGQHHRWLPVRADAPWALELAAGQAASPCLALSWWGPWEPPDLASWRARVARGRALLDRGASADQALDAYLSP